MFRRNKDDNGPQSVSGENDGGAPPLKPFSKSGSHAPAKPPQRTPAVSTAAPPRPAENPAPVVRSDPSRHGEIDSKKLIVGRDICLNGEITSCERLIVEGRIEVSLSDARFIEVAPTGYFKGNAEVKEADISGRFEGELIATERLTVRASGKISGSVRYGSIIIEPGGQVTGDMRPLDAAGPGEPPKNPHETD